MNNVFEFPSHSDTQNTGVLPVVIDVPFDTFDKLVNTARLFDTSVDEVLRRLVNKGINRNGKPKKTA